MNPEDRLKEVLAKPFSPSAKLVMLTLALRMGEDDKVMISESKLRIDTSMSKTGLHMVLKRLRNGGYLIATQDRRTKQNIYSFGHGVEE